MLKKSLLFHITFSSFFSACIRIICLADCDNLQDVCPTDPTSAAKQTLFMNGHPCKNPANITASDFKTVELSKVGDTDNFLGSSTSIITASVFLGLNTLGLSAGRTDIEVDGLVAAHSHPRASEIFFVSKGSVTAGFIDTGNRVFQTVLKEGDVFVVPRGLLHFIFNNDYELATVFSAFNSQNPGLVDISGAVFESDSDRHGKRITRKLASLSKLMEADHSQRRHAPFACSTPILNAESECHTDL